MGLTVDRPARQEILIVDDEKENLQLLQEVLHEEGYHVRPVTSGKMALAATSERKPDLVLLDVNMPEMDGYEVCRHLKEQCPDVPVLFITALHQTESKVLAFRAGGSDYITKPFQFEEVKARVRTHLGLHRLHAELKQRNEALHLAHAELLKLEGLRDNLTAMIVHDLRAPLSGVMSSLRFMLEDAEESDGRIEVEDLKTALDSARRLILMINDLLDIGRLEAAQMPVLYGEIPVAELFSAVSGLLGPEKARRVVLDAKSQGLSVWGDRGILERVFLNLADNAFKYSPTESSVEVSFIVESGGWTLVVEDRGPGIPDEFKSEVFQKFGQVRARRAKVFSTGLGLTFCRLALEAHGGSIVLEDRPGGGSRVVAQVPAQRDSLGKVAP